MKRLLIICALTLGLSGCLEDLKQQLGFEEHAEHPEHAQETALEHALKHADPNYVCPMHPQITSTDPDATCPICGMDLVKIQLKPGDGTSPSVEVSNSVAHNFALQTAPVERRTLWKYIETVGEVSYDEERIAHVHARANGWVERFRVKSLGETVKRGQVLLDYYSPDSVAAQEDYLAALKNPRGKAFVEAAEQRLRLLEVPNYVIKQIRDKGQIRQRIPILAPRDGIVTQLGARDGMYITPDLELYTIVDFSEVWVTAQVFENQQDWFNEGSSAEIKLAALPGRTWEGTVDYRYPELNSVTRTLPVRIRLQNPDGMLRPKMLTDVVIYGGPKRAVLSIPTAAVIPDAEGARVVKQRDDGGFQPVRVTLGMQANEQIEIIEGLQAGDVIVTSGQFLLDSESQLQASFQRLSRSGE